MLTINPLDCVVGTDRGVVGAAEYVLARADRPAAFASGSYYTGDEDGESDAPAIWHGDPRALGQLGLEAGARIERDELIAALQGQHVETRAQVRRPGRRSVERDGELVVEQVVKSVDLTFSVPKSVSVVWSQADPEERARIEADVIDAARRTLDFMATQKKCVHRRDAEGNRYRERAAGVAAALSLHVTARQAAGDRAPAPQLHVHGVVIGLLRQDARLVTPDPWAWYRDSAAREGGALGRALLAEQLSERGYDIDADAGKKRRYFELTGVPSALLAALSGRTREVETRIAALELAGGGRLRGAALSAVAKQTRAPKTKLDHSSVSSWWDAVAGEHGFGPREARALRAPALPRPTGEQEVARAIMSRITADGPTVSTVEARAIALESSAGRTSPRRAVQILGELQQAGHVIALEDDRVTTRPIRELEGSVVNFARRATRNSTPLDDVAVGAGVAAAEAHLGASLDSEQLAAAHAICAGGGWSNLVGRAGVGKGPTLEAVAQAHRSAGWQVLACAVDGTTAQRLGQQISEPATTIDGLVYRAGNGRIALTPTSLLVIDEASKVDTARWSQIAELAEHHGCRVLAVGDCGQLDAIELPGLFAELIKHAPTYELTEIRRHRDQDQPEREHPWLGRYQRALHDGRGQEAVAILQEHDALRLHDTRAEAMVALAIDWNQWRHDHGSTLLIVHGTNADVDTVNILAQRHRLEDGELGEESLQAPDRDYRIHAGDEIVLRGAPLHLYSGERIENGTTMRVTAVDEQRDRLTVRCTRAGEGDRITELDLAPMRQTLPGLRPPALRLAYAMHPNPAQGATVDRTATLGHPVADRNAVYVGDTRARYGHAVHLAREDLGEHADDDARLERYAAAIAESRSRSASLAYDADPRRRVNSYRPLDR